MQKIEKHSSNKYVSTVFESRENRRKRLIFNVEIGLPWNEKPDFDYIFVQKINDRTQRH